MFRLLLLTLLSALLSISTSSHAITIVAQESFTDFAAHGLRPGGGGGTLDSRHWQILGASSGDSSFGDLTTSADLARGLSAGSVRSGGLYAFALPGGHRGIGLQPSSGDFTPGALLWSVTNQTQRWLTGFALHFELWWLNDGERSTMIETQASFDGANWQALANTQTPAAADALGWQLAQQVVAMPAGAGRPVAEAEAAPPNPAEGPYLLAPGAAMWLRWQVDDASGSGSRDEFALAALQLRAQELVWPTSAIVTLATPPTLWCSALFLTMFTATFALRRYRRIRRP